MLNHQFQAEGGQVLSPEKTKLTHITDGFDFFGWNIRKHNGKLLMKPSKANVKAYLDKIWEVIKANLTTKQAHLSECSPLFFGAGRNITASQPRESPRKPLVGMMTLSGQCYGNGRTPSQLPYGASPY